MLTVSFLHLAIRIAATDEQNRRASIELGYRQRSVLSQTTASNAEADRPVLDRGTVEAVALFGVHAVSHQHHR